MEFPVGSPQGSTLGPKIFNIYCHDLINHIEKGTLISYADDSFVIVSSDNIQELTNTAERSLRSHLGWLQSNGMVCNTDKTELMVLNHGEKISLSVDNHSISSKEQMKVLGVVFDDKLTWKAHVSHAIARLNRCLHGLRLLQRHLSLKQAKQVVTSYYF